MATPQISTLFSRYTDAEFDTKAMSIFEALDGNSYFPNLPGLAELKTAIDNFRAAFVTAQNGGRMEAAEKSKARKLLQDKLHQLGGYITFTANGDKTILISSGFSLVKDAQPRLLIEPPQKVAVKNGINPGEIQVKVSAVKGARSYYYEYTPDPLTENSQWVHEVYSKSRFVFKGLQSGKKYWFRSTVIGTRGQKANSKEVASVVL
jgi:hypothetical protein